VASFVTLIATHTGPHMDVAPTGRTIRSHAMNITRIVDGRIAAMWAISDSPGYYEQLTGQPPPAGG
jgi:C-1 hydroxylase